MNNFKLSLIGTLAMVAASWGTVINVGSEQSLQSVLDTHTLGGVSSVNVNTDQVNPDSYWSLTASGTSAATMIIEIAGNASTNVMGLYDMANPANKVVLFNGAATGGTKVAVTIDGAGLVKTIDLATPALIGSATFAGNAFGYYLTGAGGTFYSDPTLNGGVDQMVSFAGKGDGFAIQLPNYATWTPDEYILGWEDTGAGSDRDFNDMVVMVESVKPIPEPTTMGLMGLGLLGMFAAARRRKA